MRRDCWHDGKLMNIRERFVVEYIDRRIFCYIFVYSAGGKIRGSLHKLLISLAPRPGLEPGTCGLTVRHSVGKRFIIRLLQHTPSFKSSGTKPRMSCGKAKQVTK